MATPLTAAGLLAALRAEGCVVNEYRSWRTHERDDETGKTFGPVNGVVIHHTAGRDSLALCYNGRPNDDPPLSGPLCHSHLSKDRVISMISAGRANHAGAFAQNAHDAVVNESSVHPRPDVAEPVDGNDHYYGLEIENLGDGKDPYPAAQYEAAVRWAAAICRAHGWSANSVIGHKEGTRRKIDPSFSMTTFRRNVAACLALPAGRWAYTTTEEDSVTLTDVDAKKVWNTDFVKAPVPDPDNPTWAPSSYLRDTNLRTRDVQTKLAALGALELTDAQIAAIANQLSAHPVLAENVAELVAAKLAARLEK